MPLRDGPCKRVNQRRFPLPGVGYRFMGLVCMRGGRRVRFPLKPPEDRLLERAMLKVVQLAAAYGPVD
jgi:hypothetical protein